MMWRTSGLLAGFVALLVTQATSDVWSQDESREERFFRYLDRDNDGRIAGEELQRLDGRMRERLREAGIDPENDIEKDRFVKSMKDRGSDDRRRGDSGKNSPAKAAPKPKVILVLPAPYATFDKNGDNQVGLYEWDRAKFAEFLALDRNGDGFLTARELDDAPRSEETATTVVPNTAGRPQTAAAASAPPAAEVAAKPASPADPPEVKQAKFYFSVIVDGDKDGKVSAEEWEKSAGVRKKFENANIAVSLPMDEATFVAKYVQSSQKK